MNKKAIKITSLQNKHIKYIRGLQLKKNRKIFKQYIIEGIRSVEEAILHNIPIEYIVYTEQILENKTAYGLLRDLPGHVKCLEISNHIFENISDLQSPQGILAVINIVDWRFEDILCGKNDLWIVMDRIQDPGNMGAIIRTAEAIGAKGIVLTKGCVDPYNNKTVRATMGALFHIPILQATNNDYWINYFNSNAIKIIACDLDTEKTYLDIDYSGRIAIIIGNEGNGIDRQLLDHADHTVKLPIIGRIESLNASVAAGIMMYKAAEINGFKGS